MLFNIKLNTRKSYKKLGTNMSLTRAIDDVTTQKPMPNQTPAQKKRFKMASITLVQFNTNLILSRRGTFIFDSLNLLSLMILHL